MLGSLLWRLQLCIQVCFKDLWCFELNNVYTTNMHGMYDFAFILNLRKILPPLRPHSFVMFSFAVAVKKFSARILKEDSASAQPKDFQHKHTWLGNKIFIDTWTNFKRQCTEHHAHSGMVKDKTIHQPARISSTKRFLNAHKIVETKTLKQGFKYSLTVSPTLHAPLNSLQHWALSASS